MLSDSNKRRSIVMDDKLWNWCQEEGRKRFPHQPKGAGSCLVRELIQKEKDKDKGT